MGQVPSMAELLVGVFAAHAASHANNQFLGISANRMLPPPAALLPTTTANGNGPATAAKQAEQPAVSANDKGPAAAAKQDEQPAASVWVRPKKGLRTPQAIYNNLPCGHQWPESMPMGPFGFFEAGREKAVDVLKAWAANPSSNGGAFTLKKEKAMQVSENGVKGPRQILACSRSRAAPGPKDPSHQQRERASACCSCKFNFTIEESTEGWIVAFMGCAAHTHELARDRAAANAVPGGGTRSIPDDLLQMGQMLSDAGVKTGAIHSAFCRTVQKRGDDITWTYKDVQSKWAATTVDHELDATNFIEKNGKEAAAEGPLLQSFH